MGGKTAQVLVAVALVLTAIPSVASAGVVEGATLYTLPPATRAFSLTAGPEGAIWFAGRHVRRSGVRVPVVGRIEKGGEIAIFDLPAKRAIGGIVAGPDGNLWFTETLSSRRGYMVPRIGRMSPTGEFGEYKIGNHVGRAGAIASGPDGNLWFVSVFWKKGRKKEAIGRIDLSGKLSRFQLPPNSEPGGIVAGPDGNLWFTEYGKGAPKIGRITLQAEITHFPLPDRRRVPGAIAVGPDGHLWFGERPDARFPHVGGGIGRIDSLGGVAEFPLPEDSVPGSLVAGPAGRLWYTSYSGTGPGAPILAIGSLTTDGVASELSCLPSSPTCRLDADSLAVGADGALWFSASKYYPRLGGGGTAIAEVHDEEAEAGLIGRFAP